MFFLDFELPLASIWVPMGSLFGIVFSTLFLNVKMAQDWIPPPQMGSRRRGGGTLWGAGNNTLGHAGGGYYVVLARFSKCRLCAAL